MSQHLSILPLNLLAPVATCSWRLQAGRLYFTECGYCLDAINKTFSHAIPFELCPFCGGQIKESSPS